MKVLAIVASARKTGNSEILAREMLGALPETVKKKMIRLADFNIEPCKACYACLPSGCDCVIQDDYDEFLQQVRAADAVIIAAPVYFLGMHTRLKLLCDRFISVLNEAEKYAGRRCVVAVPYGVEGWQGYGVEATVSFARFLHLEVVGVMPVHAANPGEVVQTEVLKRVRDLAGLLLGEEIPENNDTMLRQSVHESDLVCGLCGSGMLRVSEDGGSRCVLCGAIGRITASGAGSDSMLQCRWQPPEHLRFSPSGMKEHGARLEQIKADFMTRRHELAELRKPYKSRE